MTKLQECMMELATSYTNKLGEEIAEKEMFLLAMSWKTTSGREFRINITEMYSNKSSYLYLSEKVNNRWKRIPKTQW